MARSNHPHLTAFERFERAAQRGHRRAARRTSTRAAVLAVAIREG